MPTKESGWVHSACALWTPQTFMGQLGLIENIPQIGKVRERERGMWGRGHVALRERGRTHVWYAGSGERRKRRRGMSSFVFEFALVGMSVPNAIVVVFFLDEILCR